MTIPKITPYSGGVANPDGSQTQTEFTQNMFDQLSYEAELSTELNNTVDGINDTATQVDADATSAAQSAAAAEAAASGLNYQGLWPDTGGSADKGDTYQTQVSGTPTGKYFTALQNTTVDPVGDDVNWREVVTSEGDGSQLSVLAAGSETPRTLSNRAADSINIKDYVVGNGVIDDTRNIQRAIQVAYETGKNLCGGACLIRTTSTVYIPNFGDNNTQVVFDFGGVTLLPDAEVDVVFESGRLDNEVWVSTFDEPPVTYNSFQTWFGNFNILGASNEGKQGKVGLKIKDFHYGCVITKISGRHLDTLMFARNCFSSTIIDCHLLNSNPVTSATGSGFKFDITNNLMKLESLTSANTHIGYEFSGALTAVVMDSCSFEGQTFGLVSNGTVYSLTVENSYIEKVDDTAFVFKDQIRNATFANNYVNFVGKPSAFLFDYVPGIHNNIRWLGSNSLENFDDSQFFKVVDNTQGFNNLYIERATTTTAQLDDTYIDPNNFPLSTNINKHSIRYANTKVASGFAESQCSGRISRGTDLPNGFENESTANILSLRTKFTASQTAHIYVSIRVSASDSTHIRGFLVGRGSSTGLDFYEYTATGLEKTNIITSTLVDGFYQLGGFDAGSAITSVTGEIRHA